MALVPSLKAAAAGRFGDAFGLLFYPQDSYDAQQQVASAQDRLVNQQYQAGRLSQHEAARTLQNIAATDPSSGAFQTDLADTVWEGFKEGWQEGYEREKGFLQGTVGGVFGLVGSIFKGVPVWAWLLLGVGLFVWMGGLQLLRGRLARV